MADIKKIKAFLIDFKSKNTEIETKYLVEKKKNSNLLFNRVKELNEAIITEERKFASDYNIFYVLKNVYNKEVILHTPILADFLNINGDHKQMDLFFSKFIKLLPENEKYEIKNPVFFKIEEPKYIGPIDIVNCTGGSIDILITYNDGQKEFAIAIENKIGAIDQKMQLERYNNYLKKNYTDNYILIYLTLYGHDPCTELKNENEYSISNDNMEQLKNEKRFMCLSHQRDIVNLFQQTINDIEAENLKSIINQYLQIIKEL